METREFLSCVSKWAVDRNLVEGSSVSQQMYKLVEEMGEHAAAIARKKQKEAADGVGDAAVVLTVMSTQVCLGGKIVAPEAIPFLNVVAGLGNIAADILQIVEDQQAGRPVDPGDLRVTLGSVLTSLHDYADQHPQLPPASECLATAWNEIKDRKGQMVDGVFVKEQDVNN